MRMTTLATVVASVLLGAGVAQAGDTASMSKDQFKAADTNSDGSLTLAEAQASSPTLAAHFTSIDSNGDGKLSSTELDTYSKSGKSMDADQSTSSSSSSMSPSSSSSSSSTDTSSSSSSSDTSSTDKPTDK